MEVNVKTQMMWTITLEIINVLYQGEIENLK